MNEQILLKVRERMNELNITTYSLSLMLPHIARKTIYNLLNGEKVMFWVVCEVLEKLDMTLDIKENKPNKCINCIFNDYVEYQNMRVCSFTGLRIVSNEDVCNCDKFKRVNN